MFYDYHMHTNFSNDSKTSMEDMIKNLSECPEDTMFSINSGFNPDCEPDGEYDARPWVKKIAKGVKTVQRNLLLIFSATTVINLVITTHSFIKILSAK